MEASERKEYSEENAIAKYKNGSNDINSEMTVWIQIKLIVKRRKCNIFRFEE